MPGTTRPTNLHLLHSWGGGLQRWVRLFAAADRRSRNLVLSSVGTLDAYGIELELWDAGSGEVLSRWCPQSPICELALANDEYAARLRRVVDEYRVEHLYVSSLIGHSLDALRLEIDTTVVHHDYFPFCPGLNLFFDSACTSCRPGELRRCLDENPYSHLFRANPAEFWQRARGEYLDLLLRRPIQRVCPLPGVGLALQRIEPRFAALPFAAVEHGVDGIAQDSFGGATPGRRLRLLHLGRVNRFKGVASLRRLMPTLRLLADVTLFGAGAEGAEFAGLKRVTVIEDYDERELGAWLARLRPDAALFLSEVPETYSFTLSEVMLRAIPAVARRIGAFAARIDDGRTGYLFDGDVECVALLGELTRHRQSLRQVSRRLRDVPPRSAVAMVEEYYRLRAAARPSVSLAALGVRTRSTASCQPS